MARKKFTGLLGGVLDTSNQDFLKEWEGGSFLDENKNIYEVAGGSVYDIGKKYAGGTDFGQFSVGGGLAPRGKSSSMVSESFRFFSTSAQQQAKIDTNNFGLGPDAPTADQYTGQTAGQTSGGVTLYKLKDGTATSTPPSGQVQTAGLSGGTPIPETQPTIRAEYLGGGGVGQQVFTGTSLQDVEAQATKAGINPANLQFGTETKKKVEAERLAREPIQVDEKKTDTTVDISKPVDTSPQQKSAQMTAQEEKIKETYKTYTGKAGANKEFVNGAVQASKGRDATQPELDSMVGKTLNEVLSNLGILDRMEGFGVQEPEEPKVPPPPVTPPPAEKETEPPKNLDDRIEEYTNKITGLETETAEDVELSAKEQDVRTKKAELDQMSADLDLEKIYDIERDIEIGEAGDIRAEARDAKEAIARAEAIPMGFINRNINKINREFNLQESQISRAEGQERREEMLKDALSIYKYNTKVVQYNLAKGDAEAAQAAVQKTSDDFLEYRKMAIDDMEREQVIDQIEANELHKKAAYQWEREQAGDIPIAQAGQEEIIKAYGSNNVRTDVYGDTYLKAEEVPKNVAALQVKYPDAGILATDTFAQAAAKLPTSRIYQKTVRIAGNNNTNNIDDPVIEQTSFEQFTQAVFEEQGFSFTPNLSQAEIDELRVQYNNFLVDSEATTEPEVSEVDALEFDNV